MAALTPSTQFTPERFAPYGAVIERPAAFGERRFFSDWLGGQAQGLAPVFHTNRVPRSSLPLTVDKLEHHPHAAQAFVPLDVARYLVVVAPSDDAGQPVLERAEAFIVPGELGVVFAPRVWHAGATVLDRDGSFAVLMWRGAADDDVFLPIAPLAIGLPQTMTKTTGLEIA